MESSTQSDISKMFLIRQDKSVRYYKKNKGKRLKTGVWGSIRSTWTFQEGNLAPSDSSHSMRLYFNQVWKCTCLAFLEVHPRKETFSASFSFFPSSNPWQIHGHPRAVNAYCIIQNLAQIFRERSGFTPSTELRYSFVLPQLFSS